MWSPGSRPSPLTGAGGCGSIDEVAPPSQPEPLRRWPPIGPRGSFFLGRFWFLRLLGLVYLVAFGGMLRDGVALLGEDGLLPATVWMADALESLGGPWEATKRAPSLFWWTGFSDAGLTAVCALGVLLALVVLAGFANVPMLLALWALYFSVVTVGQRWFHFGWESQLLETTLLACTLAPLWDGRPWRGRPSRVGVVLGWWLGARIMLGAGLIKLRGGACWRELTCLDWHFETQPVPGPLSRLVHSLPHDLLAAGVLANHATELLAPVLIWGPRRLRHGAGLAMVGFQGALILSGNLSFLNWLTLVPLLLLFDDEAGVWGRMRRWVPGASRGRATDTEPSGPGAARTDTGPGAARAHSAAIWLYAAVVAWASVPVVVNLLSNEQAMNRSFGALRIVNTYGAFGSVGERRFEIVIEGTADESPEGAAWQEFAFRAKPGDLDRRPPWITPWHHRLDWLAWFAGLEAAQGRGLRREAWVAHLVWKLLEGDARARSLLAPGCAPSDEGPTAASHPPNHACTPFADAPPRWVRVRLFEYAFSDVARTRPEDPSEWEHGEWWRRRELGMVLPPLSRESKDLRDFLVARGWVEE